MGCPLAIEQHKPKQRKMRFLVSFAFLLAVASVVLSARLKRDTCAGTVTGNDCIEAFEGYEFIKFTDCKKDACDNCELCDGFTGLCRYCKEGQDKCEESCRAGKEKCCDCDEAAGILDCTGL